MSKINTITVDNVSYDVEDTSKLLQVSTMPTASAETVGKIVQFIGTTTNDYTNGYFYIGTTDGGDPATYSWEQIDVQPLQSYLDVKYYEVPYISYQNVLVFNELSKGIYFLNKTSGSEFSYVQSRGGNQTYITGFTILFLVCDAVDWSVPPTEMTKFAYAIAYDGTQKKPCRIDFTRWTNGTSITHTVSYFTLWDTNISGSTPMYLLTGGNQTFDGVKTFSSIPKQSNTTAPTQDGQLTNKKYVDDEDKVLLSNIAPTYDATSTYDVGDYVIYNNLLYVCNTTISVAEAWDSTHWTQTTVAGIIGNLNSVLASLTTPSNNNGGE